METKNHNLVDTKYNEIIFEKRACTDRENNTIGNLFNAWIILNNPKQYNSYTTKAIKEIILAFGEASNDRSVVAVVFTAVGDKAFCTGGNTKEYAEYYSGNPQEYSQYMRLFNDMVSAILKCEKPVICRVNGMRIGGGQEIGMACDFTICERYGKIRTSRTKTRKCADWRSNRFSSAVCRYGKGNDVIDLMRTMERTPGILLWNDQRNSSGNEKKQQVYPKPAGDYRKIFRRVWQDYFRKQ